MENTKFDSIDYLKRNCSTPSNALVNGFVYTYTYTCIGPLSGPSVHDSKQEIKSKQKNLDMQTVMATLMIVICSDLGFALAVNTSLSFLIMRLKCLQQIL